MNTSLSELIAHVEPPTSCVADSHTYALASRPEPFFSPVTIRMATAGDRPGLQRLAQLDSAQVPDGQTLIGEVRGEPVVAVSLADGRSIADPFILAGPILELVALRAQQLAPDARSGWTSSFRRRAASSAA